MNSPESVAVPVLRQNRSRRQVQREVCGMYLSYESARHDRELHIAAALERIAAALEAQTASPSSREAIATADPRATP